MSKAKSRTDGLIEKTKTINGKRIHFYGKTVREVQKKIDEAVAGAENKKEYGEPFEDVAEQFWKWKEPKLRYGSLKNYKSKVDRASSWFSGYGMREITTTAVSKRLSQMAMQGSSYKVIAGQKSVISLIFQYWCSEMEGDFNPCSLLKLPQGLPQKKRRAPTDEEVDKVKANPDGFGLCPAFMMYAGLRLGEVMALQKKDIAGGMISITKQVVWHGNKPVLEPPKTENAIRDVPILAPLETVLEGKLNGLHDDDFIFGGKSPYTSSQYHNAWVQYCKKIGCAKESDRCYLTGKKSVMGERLYKTVWVPDFTAHQLRHEFASTLTQCKISTQVMKDLMGHADALTTQRWYAESKKRAVLEATDILNKHFSRN